MKAYSNDLRLKVLDAVDRRMDRQGVAPTHETLDEIMPDAPSSVKLKYVAGWFSHCGYEPRDRYLSRPLSDPVCGGTGDA
jgi:hypothetical protein